jgi:hypothetical protein
MARYLALYIGSAENTGAHASLDAETEQEGVAAWAEWAAVNGGAIVDPRAPLGKTKRVDKDGVSEVANLITGYVLVDAASHAEAATIFERHPRFAVFSARNSVEIIECLEMPTE